MGQPVVHFEVVGQDGEKLQSYYAELFDWNVNADNEMKYGLVDREANSNAEGIGLGGGIGQGPDGYEGHVTFYVEVPSVEAGPVARPSPSAAPASWVPRRSWAAWSSASSKTPRAT